MSVSGKIILPLFLTVAGGLVAYATFYRFLERTRSDSKFVEIAGIQGVRAEHVTRLFYTLVRGFEWAREPLQESVERFDRDLGRLEAGDEAMRVDPVPAQLEGALAEVRRTWEPIRAEALSVIVLPVGDTGAEAAFAAMRPLLGGLSEATQDLIHASQQRTDALRRRTMVTLGAICVIDVSLMLGIWTVRSMVVVRLQIQVWKDESEAHLSVADDGRGIEPERLQEFVHGHRGGVGIAGMRERVLLLDGDFEIASDETGTTLMVPIPIRLDTDANSATPTLDP